MAKHTSRFARPNHGFLTLWALLFLAAMSLTLTIVLAGQYARIQTTTQLVRQYDQIVVTAATAPVRLLR
ncbi:hypothetical protein [Levilactobacillus acidifarinae]|uniref:Uncharacterized protein n=1 Tax=Levilactobacillus acidifarinae DSM 19394 = JCM 15949 TaxID=1423715 RepID=A0A0R1LNI2_9LACO|nr:hypothetical protein [Levilactobacillus acidifarinae]KRK93706.1 hypothetical protein FD25_GL001032 [Levilactobacillus acidifarinae DSM 19394]GEO70693.1 hypothetical protein LAC03_26030 [Levilactobacillus acidifarinae]